MDKPVFRSTVRGKLNNRGGFSYLEMLMVVFILSLCTGVITDTLALGVKHLQKLTKQSQAVILLDTLSAVVRNDLTYATDYYSDSKSFISTNKDINTLITQYGTGEWDANKALENAKYLSLSEAIRAESSVMNWKSDTDTSAVPGQIIRRSVFPNNDNSFSLYYSALTSSQDYSGKGSGGITSNSSLYATIAVEVTPITRDGTEYVKEFKVSIIIYDGSSTSSNVLAQKSENTAEIIQPIHDVVIQNAPSSP